MYYPEHIEALEDIVNSLFDSISTLDIFLDVTDDKQNKRDWAVTRLKLYLAIKESNEYQHVDGTTYKMMFLTSAKKAECSHEPHHIPSLEKISCSLLRDGITIFEMTGAEIKKYYQLGIQDLVPEDVLIHLTNSAVLTFAPIIEETKAIISSVNQPDLTESHDILLAEQPLEEIYTPSIEEVHKFYDIDEPCPKLDESEDFELLLETQSTVTQLKQAEDAFKLAIIDCDAIAKHKNSFSARYVNDASSRLMTAESSLEHSLTRYYMEHTQPFNLLLKRETGGWGYKGICSLSEFIDEGEEEGLHLSYRAYIGYLKDYLDKNPDLKKQERSPQKITQPSIDNFAESNKAPEDKSVEKDELIKNEISDKNIRLGSILITLFVIALFCFEALKR